MVFTININKIFFKNIKKPSNTYEKNYYLRTLMNNYNEKILHKINITQLICLNLLKR